ncbi:MAG: hypothetical protein R2709_04205 [Marmoricola sp.]
MSEINIAVTIAGSREEQTTTIGTKAWELFEGPTGCHAARVSGELKDLAYVLTDGDDVEGVDLSLTGTTSCATRPPTCWPRQCSNFGLRPEAGIGPPIVDGFYYDFDVETPFIARRPDQARDDVRKIIRRAAFRGATSHQRRRRPAGLAHEPYKVELIGLQGRQR